MAQSSAAVNTVTDLDLLGLVSQTVCEVCHANTDLFRYELFSTRGSLTGNCCLTCFPTLLRATGDGARSAKGQERVLAGVSRKAVPTD
jgi:hypothetical protein